MKTDMNIYVLIAILLIHWIADFVLQTDKQAKGKSKNWGDLLGHTITYSACWIPFSFFVFYSPISYFGIHTSEGLYMFPIITFIAHTITDYFTSRLNSKLWAKGNAHYFFVSVGFDQILHYVQLIITFQILSS
jgi:hypothetical protein